MSLVRDQSGGHEAEGAGVDSIRPASERQRPYPYTCLNCGAQNAGKIEDGCTQCGTGRGGVMKGPEPAVDFTCQACRGGGKVERKCATCNGTGTIGPQTEHSTPQACLTCGGGGAVAMDCARCQGTGIDPEPPVKAPPSGEGDKLMETTKPALAGPLPTLDEEPITQPGSVTRFVVVCLKGPGNAVDVLVDDLLQARDGRVIRVSREIAPSATTDRLFK